MDKRRRIHELLAERATQGLDVAGELELAALLEGQPDSEDFDLAAAAIDLALLGQLEEMPVSLRDRLAVRGRAWAETVRRRTR